MGAYLCARLITWCVWCLYFWTGAYSVAQDLPASVYGLPCLADLFFYLEILVYLDIWVCFHHIH